MVAGPNGSGKSTLMRRLAADYAVNFYDVLNADDIHLPHWASFMKMSVHGKGGRQNAGQDH